MKTLQEHQAENPGYEVWQGDDESLKRLGVEVLMRQEWKPIICQDFLRSPGYFWGVSDSHGFIFVEEMASLGAIFRRPKPRPKSLVLEKSDGMVFGFERVDGRNWIDVVSEFAKPGEKLLVTRLEDS